MKAQEKMIVAAGVVVCVMATSIAKDYATAVTEDPYRVNPYGIQVPTHEVPKATEAPAQQGRVYIFEDKPAEAKKEVNRENRTGTLPQEFSRF